MPDAKQAQVQADAKLAQQLARLEKGRVTRRDQASRVLCEGIGRDRSKDYGFKDSNNDPGHLVALYGDAGAGKSSLINALHIVLRYVSGIVSGGVDTRSLAPCFVGQGHGNGTGPAQFVQLARRCAVVDTRGYAQHGDSTTSEIREIAAHGIADGQDFVRNGPASGPRSERRKLEARHYVGAFAYVHNVQVEVTPAIVDSYRAAVRGNQKPVVVLTHIDKLSTEDLTAKKNAAMQAFGVSDSHLFAVKHIIEDTITGQPSVDRANEIELLRLMVTVLTDAERTTPPKDIDTQWVRVRDWVYHQTDLWRSSTIRKLLLLAAMFMFLALSWAAGLIVPPAGLTAQDAIIYGVVVCALFYAAQQMLRPDVARNKVD